MVRLLTIVIVAVALSVAAQANAEPIKFYPDRASFLAAVGPSFTDDYSAYGAPGSSVQLSDAAMSAVRGETAYEAISFHDLNLVAPFGDGGPSYCAGCNGNFRLSFDNTSFSVGGGVFGVGVSILFHTSRHSARGDVIPGDTVLPGTVLVEFKNGKVLAVTIPADVGFFGPDSFFLGLTDRRGIKSLTFGFEPLSRRHFWVIDDLIIADRPRGHREQPAED
jgi:hypothetical protein